MRYTRRFSYREPDNILKKYVTFKFKKLKLTIMESVI